MGDCMWFPATFDEFAEQYKIVDKQEVYTNGTELIPIFRVKQWLDHVSVENKKLTERLEREANKQLQSHVNRLKKYDEERDIALHSRLISETRADTAQKMHAEIKERCIKCGIYPTFVARTIEQVVKEILEGVI